MVFEVNDHVVINMDFIQTPMGTVPVKSMYYGMVFEVAEVCGENLLLKHEDNHMSISTEQHQINVVTKEYAKKVLDTINKTLVTLQEDSNVAPIEDI